MTFQLLSRAVLTMAEMVLKMVLKYQYYARLYFYMMHIMICSLCIFWFEIYWLCGQVSTEVMTVVCFHTARLVLSSLQTDLNPDPGSLPFILQRLDRDGSVLKGPPGYQVSHTDKCQRCDGICDYASN